MARIGLEAQRLGLPRDGPVAGQDAEGEGASSASQASKLFAIDSFNVHRLVIAGVTVASKFFSDVFYTNSRYAKVSFSSPLFELECPLLIFGMKIGRRFTSSRIESTRTAILVAQ